MTAPTEIRLAILGMIPGNGHPYSWSAIINGFDPMEMAKCPYPVIAEYLGQQPTGSVGIEGARVTHIWTDAPDDAPRVANASLIEHVADDPQDVIGAVDAVIIATDDGTDHVRRVRPFVEAGLPVFIDKPLAITMEELRQFVAWHKAGRRLMSTSGMRYAPEMMTVNIPKDELRWISSVTCKSWERYGIHALEAVYPLLGPGLISGKAESGGGKDFMHMKHSTGCDLTIAAIDDAIGSFGAVHVYGTKQQMSVTLRDTYTAFRKQLLEFISFVQRGEENVPFDQTVELMLTLIAGCRSRSLGGKAVPLNELRRELELG